jgi:putative ABC transport system substrate-binding protein
MKAALLTGCRLLLVPWLTFSCSACGRGAALAAKAATSTVPIVFASGLDPVKYGLVASLNRPGGNLTGVTFMQGELLGKQLDLLHQLVPQVTTVVFLAGYSGSLGYEKQRNEVLAAASALGLQVVILETHGLQNSSSDRDYEATFTTLVQHKAEALIVASFPFRNLDKIVALAARYKIPAIYPNRFLVAEGGLMSYGAETLRPYHQLAVDYVARILKGAKPADLPIMRSTQFELVINLKTAKALELDVPHSLLARADEVIE